MLLASLKLAQVVWASWPGTLPLPPPSGTCNPQAAIASLKDSFKIIFHFNFEYGCFPSCMSVLRVCLVPMEAGREYLIS